MTACSPGYGCALVCLMTLVTPACVPSRSVSEVHLNAIMINADLLREPKGMIAQWGPMFDGFDGHSLSAGAGFVVHHTSRVPPAFGMPESGAEERISIQIEGELREGVWSLDGDRVLFLYSAGRFGSLLQPDCVGLGRSGTVEVTRVRGKRATLSVIAEIEIVDTGRKAMCESGPFRAKFDVKVVNE